MTEASKETTFMLQAADKFLTSLTEGSSVRYALFIFDDRGGYIAHDFCCMDHMAEFVSTGLIGAVADVGHDLVEEKEQ